MKMSHSYNNLKGRKGRGGGGDFSLQVMRSVEPHSVKESSLWEAGSRSAVQLIPQTAYNPHSPYDTYSNPTVICTEGVECSTNTVQNLTYLISTLLISSDKACKVVLPV